MSRKEAQHLHFSNFKTNQNNYLQLTQTLKLHLEQPQQWFWCAVFDLQKKVCFKFFSFTATTPINICRWQSATDFTEYFGSTVSFGLYLGHSLSWCLAWAVFSTAPLATWGWGLAEDQLMQRTHCSHQPWLLAKANGQILNVTFLTMFP